MKGTWQTTDSGSGGRGVGIAAAVFLFAAVAVSIAGPVAHAAAELVRAVLIAAAVLGGLVLLGGVGLAAWRLNRRQANAARVVSVVPSRVARPARVLPAPRPELERRPEVHIHLHGATAEDVAAILREHGHGGADPAP
jgi:hypothetical protein